MTAACFGLYVGVVYIQKGAELLVFEFNDSTTAAGWLAAFIAVAFTVTTYLMEKAAHRSYGPLWLRQSMVDFTFIIGVIFWSGFAHIPGNMNSVPLEMVPITRSWFPTLQCVMSETSAQLTGPQRRSWFIEFWQLPVKWIFVAIPFGFVRPSPAVSDQSDILQLLTLLFWFDHNVSSVGRFCVAWPPLTI
jgi:hypothetical protein